MGKNKYKLQHTRALATSSASTFEWKTFLKFLKVLIIWTLTKKTKEELSKSYAKSNIFKDLVLLLLVNPLPKLCAFSNGSSIAIQSLYHAFSLRVTGPWRAMDTT